MQRLRAETSMEIPKFDHLGGTSTTVRYYFVVLPERDYKHGQQSEVALLGVGLTLPCFFSLHKQAQMQASGCINGRK